MISIICIYDNRKDYNEKLGRSLILLEDGAYELIVKKRVGQLLDNLDQAIFEASNDLILIVNENVELPPDFILKCNSYEDIEFGVVGIRGRNKKITNCGEVNVVGNELFMIHRNDYLQYRFDKLCKQHYLTDFCYEMMDKGKKNFVIDSDIHYYDLQKDDLIIMSHLRKKYHQFESVDTMNDYYPTSYLERAKKRLLRTKILTRSRG